MGLDTYAAKAVIDETGKKHWQLLDNQLYRRAAAGIARGLFSGEGNSFRGGVYNDFIKHVTGESLYQEEIPNIRVYRMVVLVQEFLNKFPDDKTYYKMDMTRSEALAIGRWLKVTALNDGSIIGWW